MLFKSKKVMGLDIGASSIKLVEVEIARRKVTLSTFDFVPTPHGAIANGEIANPQLLTDAIKSLIEKTKSKRKRAVVALWGTTVITKKISIPRIDEKLLSEQLRWEAEQYIPFDVNEISLEYQVLRKATTTPEQMNVLLVAAKRDLVLRYAEVVESAGLECAVVDVNGFALANCFELNYGVLLGQTVILLDIGASTTSFIAIQNGEVIFSRDLAVGGNTYTNDIQKTMNVSPEEAESLKISAGTGQPVPPEVTQVLAQTNEAVAEEIRRSYDFYNQTGSEIPVSRVYVTGGGLGLPGLFEQIQNVLQLPLESINPFSKVQFDTKNFTNDYIMQISPYISVALGLALRGEG